MIHLGHRLVSTGAPDDDQPWCANCGLDTDHPRYAAGCKRPHTDSAPTASCAPERTEGPILRRCIICRREYDPRHAPSSPLLGDRCTECWVGR